MKFIEIHRNRSVVTLPTKGLIQNMCHLPVFASIHEKLIYLICLSLMWMSLLFPYIHSVRSSDISICILIVAQEYE